QSGENTGESTPAAQPIYPNWTRGAAGRDIDHPPADSNGPELASLDLGTEGSPSMGSMTKVSGSLLDELSWRGLIHDSTDPAELRAHLASGRRRFYIGFDPSAPSLTIGNLLPMTLIIRGARAGLEPVVLFGGGTGMIGDPSGKSAERSLLVADEVKQNVARHQSLMSRV